jgi:pimeloyl-ACP methyl ester carboxylesterase
MINGYDMHFTDSGQGTAVLFIHPPVLTSLNFTYQIRELSAHYRTVAFDIRGHGRSGPSMQEITYPLIAADIRALMDRLEIDKAYICGYSAGGSITLEFLLSYPERALGGIVISGLSEVADWKVKNKFMLAQLLTRSGTVAPVALSVAWSQSGKNPLLFARLFADSLKGNANNAEQYYRYGTQYNCTMQLETIRHPVMLVFGEKDKLFLPYAKLLHERLPNSELYLFRDADHRIPTKEPGKLCEMISRFIEQQEKNAGRFH